MSEQFRESVKKFLFILDYPLSEWKGTQRTIYEFANYLYQMGYGVTLLENSRETKYSLEAKILIPFKVISLPFQRFGKTKMIRNVIRTEKPDVIYTANIVDPFIPIFGVKTIFGMHSMNVSAVPYMKVAEKMKFVFIQVSLSAFSLIFWRRGTVMFHADNLDQANWVKRIYLGRYRAGFVGLPVECPDEKDIDLVKHKVKNDKFTILFFGTLDRERGFETFLNTVDALNSCQDNKDIQFIIAGNGKMASLAEKAQLHFTNVRFLKKPSEEQKKKIMNESDLYIFPSWIENYSIGTVEAQLMGLPAIVLDTTPFRNIVANGRTGFLVSGSTIVEEIVEKVNYYYAMWVGHYDSYKQMRLDIIDFSKRLCKDQILQDFYKMFQEFLSNYDY